MGSRIRKACIVVIASVAGLAAFLAASAPASAATFTVRSDADTDGAVCGANCTLRQAINHANSSPGADTIGFAIGVGQKTIAVASPLPDMTQPVTVDGTTQPGFLGRPIVELRGAGCSAGFADGLRGGGGETTVRGLVVNGFCGSGIFLTGDGNRVLGNFVGTDATGTVALGNLRNGIDLRAGSGNVTTERSAVGGTGAGEGNLVAANGDRGVYVEDGAGVVVQGNLVGTDITGTLDLGNGSGVDLARTTGALVGGTTAAARNVVSGNGFGVVLSVSGGNRIQGNYVGTNATATRPLGNTSIGIEIANFSSDNTVGGMEPGAGNVISGNGSGMRMIDSANRTTVQGNLIGTDVSGREALGNGFGGIELVDVDDTLIGGTAAAARNVISGNGGNGITFANVDSRNRVQGNFIGVDSTGDEPLGNGGVGISCCGVGGDTGRNNRIGGTEPGAGNVIAFNRFDGVTISGFPDATRGESVLGNSIFANGRIGIDIAINANPPGEVGPSPNDPDDLDEGPNEQQNFPVINDVRAAAGSTTVDATLNSRPNESYRVEYFRNRECDPSHFGEGEIFLGARDVTTDGSGNADFSATFPVELTASDEITTTATDPDGNTSEFSECRADLSVRKSDAPDPVGVGQVLTYTLDIANAGPAAATNITVVDTLPPSVTFGSAEASQGTCSEVTGTVRCELGRLVRGGRATVTIEVTTTQAGPLENRASVSSGEGGESDPDPSNNEDTATTTVGEAPATGTIVVEKQTTPDGDPARFSFSGDAAGSIGDGERITVPNLEPGTYRSTETVPGGWDLSSISCTDSNSSGDLASRTATFIVDTGETVRCTFTNTKRANVVIEKQTTPDGAAGSFTFIGVAPGSIGDDGQLTASNLLPGTYSAQEADPAPAFDPESISCNDNNSSVELASRTATLRLEPGETVKCVFTNKKRPVLPPNRPPTCNAIADPDLLWPPNHKFRLISLSRVTDPDGDPVTVSITTVTQDEPLNGLGDGDTAPDAKFGSTATEVYVRAERSGLFDGRVYRINYRATDSTGALCTGIAAIGVPHDQGQGRRPIDSGPPIYNSFGP